MSAFGLAAQLNIERSAAALFIERYFARYPGVAEYMRVTREKAREQGYVETVFGRRLYLENIASRNQGLRAGAVAVVSAGRVGGVVSSASAAGTRPSRWRSTFAPGS